MSVFVFADTQAGAFKKAALEALNYGAQVAEQLQTSTTAVVIGPCEAPLESLGRYGADQVLHAADEKLKDFDATVYTAVLAEAAREDPAAVVVMAHNFNGRALAPMLSIALQAGLVTGAVSLPDTTDGFVVKKGAFSGKAFAAVRLLTEQKIIALNPNSFPLTTQEKTAAVSVFSPALPEPRVQVKEIRKLSGDVPLTEAEIIVSGGRGLKGPENWGMLEELAAALGAATACSRPVADSGWRPHHEHVGQTGITVRPNLYIAIGISGAIQHLAGVNGSKYLVVINKDPEAPFFKAADYGIVGDAFEVVPKLTAAVRKFKESH